MTQTSDNFSAFASVNRYFELSITTKPTLQEAENAVLQLCKIYGAKNEEELLSRGDTELIKVYKEIKSKIMRAAE